MVYEQILKLAKGDTYCSGVSGAKPESPDSPGFLVRLYEISVPQFNGRCPDSGGPLCGRDHRLATAGRIGLSVDDVAGMLPVGQLVPLRYYTNTTLLVSPEEMARYQDATGGLGAWHPADERRTSERFTASNPSRARTPCTTWTTTLTNARSSP